MQSNYEQRDAAVQTIGGTNPRSVASVAGRPEELHGLLLYDDSTSILQKERHEIDALKRRRRKHGMKLWTISPRDVELYLTGQHSLRTGSRHGDLPDFVINRMGTQSSPYALGIQRKLECAGVMAFNSAQTVRIVADKWDMQQELDGHVPCPKSMLIDLAYGKPDLTRVADALGNKFVLKQPVGSHGAGMKRESELHSLGELFDLLVTLPQQRWILQEFIEESAGTDIRVFVVGKPIAAMKRVAKKGWQANASRGGKVFPIELNDELCRLAETACDVLGLEIAGCDFVESKDGYLCLECNSSPGFSGMQRAHPELSIADEILSYVRRRVIASRNDCEERPVDSGENVFGHSIGR